MVKPPDNSSRYSSTGEGLESSYVGEAKDVLVNRRGIRNRLELAREEERGYARAHITLIKEFASARGPLTNAILCKAHAEIFGHLFEWAGRWRTVNISKESMTWPPAMFLDQNMRTLEQDVLGRYPSESFTSDEEFCKAISMIQGEFLAVHPFREGNARTIKLCTNLLAIQSGRPPLMYDKTDEGRKAYIHANKLVVHQQNYSQLEAIISEALTLARSQRLYMGVGRIQNSEEALKLTRDAISKDVRELERAICLGERKHDRSQGD